MDILSRFKEVNKTSRLLYMGFALAVGILFEFLFWRGRTGIGIGLFSLIYTLGFLALTLSTGQLKNKKALWLLVPTFIMSADVALL